MTNEQLYKQVIEPVANENSAKTADAKTSVVTLLYDIFRTFSTFL
jgi:hypothetical protein